LILNNPTGLLALLGVPVIILLYLLKQKREDYIISSLYLWKNALRDMEANAPWQKLKKNILMYLQIVSVVVLSLLLSQPVISGSQSGDDVLIVLDCSLSMQSTDYKPTRFEAALKDAVELVESGRAGTVYSIIALTDTPYLVLQNSDDKQKVITHLKGLRAIDTAEDSQAASDLVKSLLRQNPDIRVCWFGDTANSIDDENISYYPYNRNGENYSVTLLTYRRLSDGTGLTALSKISNFSHTEAELDVSLYTDGEIFDAKRVNVSPGTGESIYWTGIPDTVNKLEVVIDTEDVLKKDNSAGLVINQAQKRRVLLAADKNVFLEKLFEVIPDIEVYRTSLKDADALKGYDLYVFDSHMPEELPQDGHIMIFNPPENKYFSVSGASEYSEISAAEHDIMDGLNKEVSFSALKTSLYDLPPWASPMLKNDEGTAAFEGYLDNRRIMVFGFDLHETNLPLKPFFPVLMTRAVQHMMPLGLNDISSAYAGDAVDISADPEAQEVYIINPEGEKTVIGPPFPVTSFSDTQSIGMYTLGQVSESGTYEQQFFVNAASEKEFNVSNRAYEDKEGNDALKTGSKPGGLALTLPLLWLLLALLMLEWWVYANGNTV